MMGLALGAATFHLGQPLKAWRSFLGWRRSWFSREAIAFGGYLGMLALCSFLTWNESTSATVPMLAMTVLLGVVSVFCSFMVYVDTRREFWSSYETGVRFAGTTLLLGFAGSLALQPGVTSVEQWEWIAMAVIGIGKLLLEARVWTHFDRRDWTPLKRSSRLLLGPLRKITSFRMVAGLMGAVVFPFMALLGMIPSTAEIAVLVFALLLAGELAERTLFFTAVSPTQMPGGITS